MWFSKHPFLNGSVGLDAGESCPIGKYLSLVERGLAAGNSRKTSFVYPAAAVRLDCWIVETAS